MRPPARRRLVSPACGWPPRALTGAGLGGPAAASPEAAGSPHQIGEREIEGVGDEQEIHKVRYGDRRLVPVDGLVVAADAFAELDLGQAGRTAGGTDAFPDLPAAVGDPVGHGVERHPPTFERSWAEVFTRQGKSWDLGNPVDTCRRHTTDRGTRESPKTARLRELPRRPESGPTGPPATDWGPCYFHSIRTASRSQYDPPACRPVRAGSTRTVIAQSIAAR